MRQSITRLRYYVVIEDSLGSVGNQGAHGGLFLLVVCSYNLAQFRIAMYACRQRLSTYFILNHAGFDRAY
jgi:hypothetical protein